MAQPLQSVMGQPIAGGASVPAPAFDAPAPMDEAPAPVEAADTDVIEVEWVERAKHVVAETHDDPYQQVMQLNQLKAEYMQKRYNKTVKLPDA